MLAFLIINLILLIFRVVWLYATNLELYGDEAQYWFWSLEPAWGYYSKPPVVAWLIWLTTRFSDVEWAIRLSSPIIHALVGCVVYQITHKCLALTHDASVPDSKKIDAKKASLLAGLIYITAPSITISSGLISTDPALMLCYSLTLCCFIYAYENNRLWQWVLVGVFGGTGMLSKYSMALFPLGVLIFLFFFKASQMHHKFMTTFPKMLLAGIIAFLILLPNLFWVYSHQMATMHHMQDLAAGGIGDGRNILNFLEFFWAQFGMIGPIFFAFVLYIIGLEIKFALKPRAASVETKPWPLILLFIFAMLPLVTMLIISLFSRAHGNWAAPAYVPISVILGIYFAQFPRFFIPALVPNIGVLCLILLYPFSLGYFPYDVFGRLKGGRMLGEKVCSVANSQKLDFIITDNRMQTALIYYYCGRQKPELNIQKWNPHHLLRDHFDMVGSGIEPGVKALFISQQTSLEDISNYAEDVKEIEAFTLNNIKQTKIRILSMKMSCH